MELDTKILWSDRRTNWRSMLQCWQIRKWETICRRDNLQKLITMAYLNVSDASKVDMNLAWLSRNWRLQMSGLLGIVTLTKKNVVMPTWKQMLTNGYQLNSCTCCLWSFRNGQARTLGSCKSSRPPGPSTDSVSHVREPYWWLVYAGVQERLCKSSLGAIG